MRALNLIWGLTLVIVCIDMVGCAHKQASTSPEGASVQGISDKSTQAPSISLDPKGSDGKQIEGLASVHFGYDRSSPEKSERKVLQTNAEWILAHPNLRIQIEGHCDNRGSVEYNLALGEHRAKAIQKYLQDLGVPVERLTIISYGKEKPLVDGDSEEAYAKNRRANFVPLK